MEYESLFSPYVKRKIRRIVKQSECPMLMTVRVKAEFGDVAISFARQIAVETRGAAWLKQEPRTEDQQIVEPISQIPQNSGSPTTREFEPLALAFPRGREEKTATIKEPEATQIAEASENELEKKQIVHTLSSRAAQHLESFRQSHLFKSLLWCTALFALGFVIDEYSRYNKAEKIKEERASIGSSASVVGAMWASALRSCHIVGILNLPDCVNNTGLLLQDTTSKTLAEIAMRQVDDYTTKCERNYSKQYCLDLVNRAIRISYNTRN